MARVTCLIPTRDGELTLPSTLDSLRKQTVPLSIVAVDDCSIDDSRKILRNFKVSWIGCPKRGRRDYAKVPYLLNLGMKLAPESDYYMISGDDCIYPETYVETIIQRMEENGIDCASGSHGPQLKVPSGSGRILTARLWRLVTPFPTDISWESGMLFKGRMAGLKYAVYDAKFIHERKFGLWTTRTFGHGAYMLGYPIVYSMAKVILDIVKRRHTIANSLAILVGHIEYILRRVDKSDIAPFVSLTLKQKICSYVMEAMG